MLLRHLFLAMAICLATAMPQDNTDTRAGGLIASILDQDPLGQEGRQTNSGLNEQDCCCVRRNQQCPDPDLDDEYTGIDVRIVNDPPNSGLRDCPRNRRRCCYSSRSYVDSLGSTCRRPGGGNNGGGGQGWETLCPSGIDPRRGVKTCGQRSFTPLNNLKKAEASPEEFPWTCLVLKGDNKFVSTCTIVPERGNNDISRGTSKVLTVVHKLKELEQNDLLKVRVLEYDARGFNSPPEKERHQEYTVVKITEHPDYKPRRFSSNLAVLTLDRKINLQSQNGINAACIPECPEMFDYQFSNGTGTRCWVAGWGKDRQGGNFQPIMHKVDLPIYDRSRCEGAIKDALRAEGNARTADRFKLHPSEMCAGGELGKDACEGDGGAPLVCRAENDRWYVVGLVAWGVNCANQNVPGIYARISHFRRFINQN